MPLPGDRRDQINDIVVDDLMPLQRNRWGSAMSAVLCDFIADATFVDSLNGGSNDAVDRASDKPCYHRRADQDSIWPTRITCHSQKSSNNTDNQGSEQRGKLAKEGDAARCASGNDPPPVRNQFGVAWVQESDLRG